jgi:hypothetical protein
VSLQHGVSANNISECFKYEEIHSLMESKAHEGNNCFLVVTASSNNESDVKIGIWKTHIHLTREIENGLTTG